MPPATALAYRDVEILSASPIRLVVITFDAALAALTRARTGITMSNRDLALSGLDKTRQLVGELLGSLDRERGGDLAARLASVYAFTLSELTDLGVRPDLARLDRTISMVRQLRDAFAEISHVHDDAAAVA